MMKIGKVNMITHFLCLDRSVSEIIFEVFYWRDIYYFQILSMHDGLRLEVEKLRKFALICEVMIYNL